jgi:hypothetical protein
MYNYVFNLSDFTSLKTDKPDKDSLFYEVRNSQIQYSISNIVFGINSTVEFIFRGSLSNSHIAILNSIVAKHLGLKMYDVQKVQLSGASVLTDGKPIFVESPATDGFYTFKTSRMDADPAVIDDFRGNGDRLELYFNSIDNKTLDIKFYEPIEVIGGKIEFNGQWDVKDEYSLYIKATGFLKDNLTYQNGVLIADNKINLSEIQKASPIYTRDKNGFFDIDYFTGEIKPNFYGSGEYNIYGFDINLKMLSNCHVPKNGIVEIKSYRTQYIHQNYITKFNVKKLSGGDANVRITIDTFRTNIV